MLKTRVHLAQPVETKLILPFGNHQAGETVRIDRVACNGDEVTPAMFGLARARQFVPLYVIDEATRAEIIRQHRAALQ